jgi:hypothetical protein
MMLGWPDSKLISVLRVSTSCGLSSFLIALWIITSTCSLLDVPKKYTTVDRYPCTSYISVLQSTSGTSFSLLALHLFSLPITGFPTPLKHFPPSLL